MRLDELVGDVRREREEVVHDYFAEPPDDVTVKAVLDKLEALRYREMLELERLAQLLASRRAAHPPRPRVTPRGVPDPSPTPRLPRPPGKPVFPSPAAVRPPTPRGP